MRGTVRAEARGSVAPKQSVASTRDGLVEPEALFGTTPTLLHRRCDSAGGSLASQSPLIQRQLRVGRSDDRYEQEADQVADAVMRMPDRRLQRQAEPEEEEEEEELIQTKESGSRPPQLSPTLQTQIGSLRGRGGSLPQSARRFFEPRFQHNFGDVRVHTGGEAAQAARRIQARAFTVGQDIVFGAGQYAPDTDKGKRLLAHELTHTIQQGRRYHPEVVQRQKRGDTSGMPKIPPELLPLFSSFQTLGITAAQLYKAYIVLKSIGMSAVQIRRALLSVLGLAKKNVDVAKHVIGVIGEAGASFVKVFEALGKAGIGLTLFLGCIEAMMGLLSGSIGAAQAALYRAAMSVVVPWAGLINAVQSLIGLLIPSDIKDSPGWDLFFKVLRSIDPIALGAIAIDSAWSLIQTMIDVLRGKSGIVRLSRLVDRMLGAGAGLFVEAGEFWGDVFYDLINDDDEVRALVRVSGVKGLRRTSAKDKVKMISTLMSGWISDADVKAIETICASVTSSADAAVIRRTVTPWLTSMQSLGQRMRVEIALGKMPG